MIFGYKRKLTLKMITFVESKSYNMDRISTLLEISARNNHWANRGPIYEMLRSAYREHLSIPENVEVVPCANGGIALESMARLLESQKGKKLRWIASAFSFQNLGRGYFSDVQFVDCTESGLLDLSEVRALPSTSFDGLVVVNPLGHARDFSSYIAFARATGKCLLIDNAAGISQTIPDWPWQSFSLHHTKPYGMGEGGLAITPSNASDALYELINYGQDVEDKKSWFNNGKISDISCSFHLDRLEQVSTWSPLYFDQAERIFTIAQSVGLETVLPFHSSTPATSWAFVLPCRPTANASIDISSFKLAKYYKPLAELPNAVKIYQRIINVPCHPDMAELPDTTVKEQLELLL